MSRRAAEFWMYSSLRILVDVLYRMVMLQYSSREVMKARMSIPGAEKEREGRRWACFYHERRQFL